MCWCLFTFDSKFKIECGHWNETTSAAAAISGCFAIKIKKEEEEEDDDEEEPKRKKNTKNTQ